MRTNKRTHIIWTLVIALMFSVSAAITMTEQAHAAAQTVKTVNIDKKKVTLTAGTKCQITAKFGNKTVTKIGKWTTNNKKVAIVSNKGIVNAKSAGKAMIQVRYKNKTKRIWITVKSKKPQNGNIVAYPNDNCDHTWKILDRPNCAIGGIKKCSKCGQTEYFGKPTNKHKWKLESKATCAKPAYYRCTVCETRKRKGNKLGHDWDAHTDIYECGAGKPYYSEISTCSHCHKQFTVFEEADKHILDETSECFGGGIETAIHKYTYPVTKTIRSSYGTCRRCKKEMGDTETVLKTENKIFYGTGRHIISSVAD